MFLTKYLGLAGGDVCSIVGAGGKTSLLYALAEENHDQRVIATTTTRMWDPGNSRHPFRDILVGNGESLRSGLGNYPVLLAETALEAEPPGRLKLKGFPADAIDGIYREFQPHLLLIEADGAAGKSVKMPAPYEPPIPPLTTVVCGVIGLDCLGVPASEDNIHRFPLFSENTGLLRGQKLEADHLRLLINHREGLFKNTPPGAEKIVVLNKADRYAGDPDLLCETLLRDPRIDFRLFLTDLSDYARPVIRKHTGVDRPRSW